MMPKSGLSRRAFLGAAIVGFAGAGWYVFGDTAVSTPISPDLAFARMANKTLILVDIRRPDEWALTGIATGAVPLDMRADDFMTRLRKVAADNPSAGIALICARGVRSRRVAAKLTKAGFAGVLDIAEGMLGSAAGPGWIARGLPLTPYSNGVSG